MRVPNEVIAETEWVLRSGYQLSRETIATSLMKLIEPPCMECVNKDAVLEALAHYGATGLDIVDCLIAAEAIEERLILATFDSKIGKRVAGLDLWEPA